MSPQRSIVLIICSVFILNLNAWAQSPASQKVAVDEPTGPIVEMEPYIVKGERILPQPESWFYISIPAVRIKRGNRAIYVPGYEVLWSRSRENARVFAGHLQLRQVANALAFPDFVSSLPRSSIIVALDDGRLRNNTSARTWEGDSLYTATALKQSNGRPDMRYSIGTQINTQLYSDFLTELPSRYAENADRNAPDTGEEQPRSKPRDVAKLVGIAANGGPFTVYLDDTREELRGAAGGPSFFTTNYDSSYALIPVPGPSGLLHGDRDEDGIVSEAAFGRELSQRLALLGWQIARKSSPEWLRAGLGGLCRKMQVSDRHISFNEFPKYVDINSNIIPPKLIDVLSGKQRLVTIRHSHLMAQLFVHYCLYSDNGARKTKFFNFVERLEKEPFSEALFKECFGQTVFAFQSAVIIHWHMMSPKKLLIYKWETPPLFNIVVREATQSEVARLKAEMLIARGQSPKALDELRIAYWRGEREPWMLALLALLEEHIGSLSRAEKITKMLLALPRVPARAYVVAAKLRLREFGEGERHGGKLAKAQVDSVMALLVEARTHGLLNEDLCATLSKLILSSAEPPDDNVRAFIIEAARRYPLNRTITAALKHGEA